MNSIKAYTLAIISVCIAIAIIRKITENHQASAVVNVICGLVLTITVISPVVKLKIADLNHYTSTVQADADLLVNQGVERSEDQLKTIISDEISAYILEKASMYECSIDRVEVILSDDALPAVRGICITGRYSPHAKKNLSDTIEANLGVAKESQQWRYQN